MAKNVWLFLALNYIDYKKKKSFKEKQCHKIKCSNDIAMATSWYL